MISTTELERLVLAQITKSTSRGTQVSIGPSEIGSCPYCIGVRLAQRLPDVYVPLQDMKRFNFTGWRGTAIHEHIQNTFEIEGAKYETKLEIHDLQGYGLIRGSCDFYYEGKVVDWKCPARYTYDKLTSEGMSSRYRVQAHLYGWGYKKLGLPVDTVGLALIPQFSNSVYDMRFLWEGYNQEVVDSALARLETIWAWVQQGDLDEVPADEDCYQCSMIGRINVEKVKK